MKSGKLILFFVLIFMMSTPVFADENLDRWGEYVHSGIVQFTKNGTRLGVYAIGTSEYSWGNCSKFYDAKGLSADINVSQAEGNVWVGIRRYIGLTPGGHQISAEAYLSKGGDYYRVRYKVRERDPVTGDTYRVIDEGNLGNWAKNQTVNIGFKHESDTVKFFSKNKSERVDLKNVNMATDKKSTMRVGVVWTDAGSGNYINATVSNVDIISGGDKDVDLRVNIPSYGTGTVTMNPPGSDCSFRCTESYEKDTNVTLTANSNDGYEFDCWDDGMDANYDNPNTITMNADKRITARYLLSEIGIDYICEYYGKNYEGYFWIEKKFADKFDCGSGITGIPGADGKILCKGSAIVGEPKDFGRCGPGSSSPGPKYGYTQDCFNHDLCVRELENQDEWQSPYTWSELGPCGDEFAKAVRDFVAASDCTIYKKKKKKKQTF